MTEENIPQPTQPAEPALPEPETQQAQTDPQTPAPAEAREQIQSGLSTKSLAVLVILALMGAAGYGGLTYWQKQQNQYNSIIAGLQKQVGDLQKSVASDQKAQQAASAQIDHLQEIHAKSQDQILTDAVGAVTPSVVSIVISKDVPQLSVVYENPFGNDPFFQNLGIQVPVYQQNGVQRQKIGAGSGFIISSDGYILTNKHVVFDDAADYTVLLSNGKQKTAKVIYKDPTNDIAIVKIDGTGYQKVTFGDSSALKLGQTVIAIGNALGEYNNSVSVGIISGLNRSIQASGETGTEELDGVLQTDAAINPGNSGGPLADLNGNVVGINVATVQGSSNISFSIPINTVKAIIKTVLNK